ncbi:MAG TPA: hypothetical protein VEP67_11925 [Thiobacillaceae bacterium]|nr:hypothetical protein [Thiobacillaceae bacterium]
MFIGHYGVGLAAKSVAPRVSLGALFLAAQFLDLLCAVLLLLGIERVRIVPGATAVTPLVFEYYPVSHSLAAALAWALLVSGGYLLIRRERTGAVVLGVLVISHWVLDAIVHQPDLPLLPGGTTMIGLNAWSSLPVTLAIEVTLFAVGAWLYFRATSPIDAIGRWGYVTLVVFLLVTYAGSLFGRPPPNAGAVAWVGQLQWLLVLWGYWIDKHRRVTWRPRRSQP